MNLRGINMLSWIYYERFVCLSLVGATLTVYNIDNHYVISTIAHNSPIRFTGWLLVLYSMIIFPLGVLCVKKFFQNRRAKLILSTDIYPTYQYPLLYFLTFISIVSCIYVFFISGYIGLFNILTGQATAEARISYSRHFAGNVYVRNILAEGLSFLLSMIWYTKWKCSNKKQAKCYFYIMLCFAVLMTTQNYAKGPIIHLFLSFVMLRIYLFGRLSKKAFISMSSAAVLGIMLVYILVAKADISQIFSSYNSGILGRIFLSEVAGLFKAFQFFPAEHDFIGFHSISRLLMGLLGSEYVDRSARIVMTLFNPSAVASGTAGVMNSLFIAEAWANWGWLGALLSPLIVGMITGIIYYSTTCKKNVYCAALYGYLALRIPITGGFNDFIYPIGILIPLSFAILIVFTRVSNGNKSAQSSDAEIY